MRIVSISGIFPDSMRKWVLKTCRLFCTPGIFFNVKGRPMKPRRNCIIAVTILALFLVWGSAASAAQPASLPNGWKHYSNPEAGFSFGYPGNWSLEEIRTTEPTAGFRVRGNGLDIYTDFLGGFEQYGEIEARPVTLADGTWVSMDIYREIGMLPGDVIEDPNRRLILVTLPDIGPSGLLIYSYDVTADPGAPDTVKALLATFTIIDSSTAARDIPSSWLTHTSCDSSLSFRYPPDWEITEDFLYTTAAGVTADVPSIMLEQIGNEDPSDWIRINPRQFQDQFGTCLEAGEHTICTYSKDPAVKEVMERIVSTFSMSD